MKIVAFSDLHLEFGSPFTPPPEGDVMVLAGDIRNLSQIEKSFFYARLKIIGRLTKALDLDIQYPQTIRSKIRRLTLA